MPTEGTPSGRGAIRPAMRRHPWPFTEPWPSGRSRRHHGRQRTSWYSFGYHDAVDASRLIADARQRSRLTLRALAARAGTSHSTLAAYESGRKSPNVATLDRILSAAGFAVDVELHRRHRGADGFSRGDELAAVLELAAAFPARHDDELTAPVFGRT